MQHQPTYHWPLALVAAASLLLLGLGPVLAGIVPSLWAPMPLPWFVLAFLGLGRIAFILPAAAFLAWTPQLRRGNPIVPLRSTLLLVLCAIFSTGWAALAWSYGVRYQGQPYTTAVLAGNALWLAVLVLTYGLARRRPTLATSYIFHWLLFAWLAWYAFPFLGELP